MNAHLEMSLRDWFAGMAMQGMAWASVDIIDAEQAVYRHYPTQLAKLAYDLADAMLAEREDNNHA